MTINEMRLIFLLYDGWKARYKPTKATLWIYEANEIAEKTTVVG